MSNNFTHLLKDKSKAVEPILFNGFIFTEAFI